MRAVAVSMEVSTTSFGKKSDAKKERNGIILFSAKVDAGDDDSKEYFVLQRKIHLQKARTEISAASPLPHPPVSPLPVVTQIGFNALVYNVNNETVFNSARDNNH